MSVVGGAGCAGQSGVMEGGQPGGRGARCERRGRLRLLGQELLKERVALHLGEEGVGGGDGSRGGGGGGSERARLSVGRDVTRGGGALRGGGGEGREGRGCV